jgi:hypothetical protein
MAGRVPDKVTPPESIKPLQDVGQEPDKQPAGGFDQAMQNAGSGTNATQEPGKISPMDLAAQTRIQTTPPTLDTINTQMQHSMGSLGDIHTQLNTKNLKLKQSQKYLLRNKLTEANTHIRTATEQAGETPENPTNIHARQNPVMRFMGIVQNSQTNLEKSQKLIAHLNSSGKAVEPGRLLMIQVKLAKAQQDLEYSSVLLSKAVDDIKMMFNIQL